MSVQILRDESCILIPQQGKSYYVIEPTNIRTDNDVQPALEKLKQQPWATEEICLKVECLLKEWLEIEGQTTEPSTGVE